MKNIIYTAKFLKFEEMEYLIHYVKFKMWPVLFYENSLSFPISSIGWKLRFLNVGIRLYLHSLCTQKLKTGIFECCSKLNFQFFPIHERDEKLKFLNVNQ